MIETIEVISSELRRANELKQEASQSKKERYEELVVIYLSVSFEMTAMAVNSCKKNEQRYSSDFYYELLDLIQNCIVEATQYNDKILFRKKEKFSLLKGNAEHILKKYNLVEVNPNEHESEISAKPCSQLLKDLVALDYQLLVMLNGICSSFFKEIYPTKSDDFLNLWGEIKDVFKVIFQRLKTSKYLNEIELRDWTSFDLKELVKVMKYIDYRVMSRLVGKGEYANKARHWNSYVESLVYVLARSDNDVVKLIELCNLVFETLNYNLGTSILKGILASDLAEKYIFENESAKLKLFCQKMEIWDGFEHINWSGMEEVIKEDDKSKVIYPLESLLDKNGEAINQKFLEMSSQNAMAFAKEFNSFENALVEHWILSQRVPAVLGKRIKLRAMINVPSPFLKDIEPNIDTHSFDLLSRGLIQ